MTLEGQTHCKVSDTEEAKEVFFKYSLVYNEIQKSKQQAEVKTPGGGNRFSR